MKEYLLFNNLNAAYYEKSQKHLYCYFKKLVG